MTHMSKNILNRVLLCAAMIICCTGEVWASHSKHTHTITVNCTPSGSGKVYASASSTESTTSYKDSFSESWDCGKSSSGTHNKTYYLFAEPNNGYYFKTWGENSTSTNQKAVSTGSIGGENSDNYTYTATFEAVTIDGVVTNAGVTAENRSTDYSGTVVFSVPKADATADLAGATVSATEDGTYAATATAANGGKFTITGYEYTATGQGTVRYTFNGQGGTGTDAHFGTHTAFIKLTTAAGTGYFKTAEVTANVLAQEITGSSSDAVYATDPSTDVAGSAVFTTNRAISLEDFYTPTITNATYFTLGTASYADNRVTIPFTFNGNGEYGAKSAEVTLKQKSDNTSRTVTLNGFAEGHTGDTELFPSSPTTEASGELTFYTRYAEADITTTLLSASGEGTWTIINTTYNDHVLTVNYKYNPDGYVGTATATLALTPTSGSAQEVGVTATVEAEKDYDVEVFDKNGVSVFTGVWAAGVANVNANEGSTIQLARDIDLGILTTSYTFNKTTTLDLNGKTLSATSASGKYLIYLNTANKTLTIKDSKNGGTISAVGSANTTLYAVYINQGNLVLNSGKIYAENQLPYASGTSVSVRALQLAANVNFTMNGGEITGEAGNSAYGIRHEGGATAMGKVIINDGTINANCKRQYAYGIYELGKLEVHGGTINAKTYTSTGTSDAYGIYLSGGANMDTSKEYGAELTMDGGTINAQSQTSGEYGVYVGGSVTIFKDAEGVYQHSLARAYPAAAYISGGTFNAFSTTSSAYGLRVMNSVKTEDETISTTVVKPTIVTGGTFNATATTSSAYGIIADAQSSWGYGTISFGVVEVSNVEATATTGTSSAYGAYVNTNAKIFDEGNTKMNYHNTYKVAGEWVSAGKMTIHSGTFKGIAGTSTAAGVGCATRAAVRVGKTSDNIKYAYGELNIDGGTFSGKTTTTNAYGVVSGGNTTITGGTFSADATTTAAYGVYTTSGKTTISNVPVTVVARGKDSNSNGNAYGLLASCSVANITGIVHPSELVANNLTVNVTTTTAANARGVSVSTTQLTLTDATFSALKAADQTAYANMYVRGEWATAGKAIVNGGTYTVTSATTYAYGARVENASITASGNTIATGELEINGGTFTAKTQGTTTAYGVYTGGKTTIDGATFNVQPMTTNAYGLYLYDKKTTVSNSSFNVTATEKAYGAYLDAQISSTYGYLYQSELESTNNTFDVKTTSGNTAQAIALVANKRNIASGTFAGDYVAASKATINSGTYKAQSAGTTAYGVFVAATVVQGSLSGKASCVVNGGTFVATATKTSAGGFRAEGGVSAINGGSFLGQADAAPSSAGDVNAYGLVVTNVATVVDAKDATFAAKLTGTNSRKAFGIYAAGLVTAKNCTLQVDAAYQYGYGVYSTNDITVEDCDITVNTTYAYNYGLQQNAAGKTMTAKNNTVKCVSGTTYAYGLHVNNGIANDEGSTYNVTANMTTATSAGDCNLFGAFVNTDKEATLNNCQFTAKGNASYAKNAYGIYNAGTVTIDECTVDVSTINAGAYALRGTTAETSMLIRSGHFKASASSSYAPIYPDACVGKTIITGGYYNVNTNLATFVADGYSVGDVLPTRPEYAEGYRYTVFTGENFEVAVCKIVETGQTFITLEDALAYVNNNSATATILMLAQSYTLPAGNYTLPSNATLLIPYKADQTSPVGTVVTRTTSSSKLNAFRKLILANGVNLNVYGTIEVSAEQKVNTSSVAGPYGFLQLLEGSKITLQNGSKLNAWGYVAGVKNAQGTIDARRGSTVREMFQIGDWKGGGLTATMSSGTNKSTYKVFPVNQYYIQNVETPITFHPGAKEICQMGVNISDYIFVCDGVNLIGVIGETALFLMDKADDSEDTWVRKRYDTETDQLIFEANSSASLGSLEINLPIPSGLSTFAKAALALIGVSGSITMNSADYNLPITNNMKVRLLSGYMDFTQTTVLLPGAEVEVDKEATISIGSNENRGIGLYLYDKSEWGNYVFNDVASKAVGYSPSWSTCPRIVALSGLKDAEINVHGKLEVYGGLYTTSSGANIFSTNSDAGQVWFQEATGSATKTLYHPTAYHQSTGSYSVDYGSNECPSAKLKNAAPDSYSLTAGAAAGSSYCYIDGVWKCLETDGCFTIDKTDQSNWVYYAKPADYVALASEIEDDEHLYHSATGSRIFILDDTECQWWEVEPVDDYYHCIHPSNDVYYYYDEDYGVWVVKQFSVTWKNWDGTTITTYDNVAYNSTPKYLGSNPTRAKDAYYTYDFVGWLPELSPVKGDAVFIAQYEKKDRKYTVTFKDGSTTLETDYYKYGEYPICHNEPTKAGYTLSWSPVLGAVTGDVTYTAQWSNTPKASYSVTFKNHNGDVLQAAEQVATGTLPTYRGETPTKASVSADAAFEFDGWTPALDVVSADVVYTAKFREVAPKYTITFKSEGGASTLQTSQVAYGETPVYTGVTPTKVHSNPEGYYYELVWSPLISAVVGDQTYVATFEERPNTMRLIVESNGVEKGTVSVRETDGTAIETAVQKHSATYDYNHQVQISATANKAQHYHFARWSDGATSADWRTITVTGTITHTAIFEPDQFTITDGSNSMRGTVDGAGTYDYGTIVTLTAKPKDYCRFVRWSDGVTTPSRSVTVTSDVTYTAEFDAVAYMVHFDANGGSGSMADQEITYGATQALTANAFTHAKYTITYNEVDPPQFKDVIVSFTGWNTLADGSGTTYTDEHSVKNLTDVDGGVVTLYAQWSTETISLLSPERSGYAFDGWYDAATDGNLIGAAGASYSPSASRVLYAHWHHTTPTSVSVSGTWNRFPGETITLTAAAEGAADDAVYQWKRGDVVVGTNSATLTIPNCTAADGGNYTCTVSNGSCSLTSSAFGVKVFYMKTSYDSWAAAQNFTRTGDKTGTVSIELGTDWSYEFKIFDGVNAYGYSGAAITGDASNLVFSTSADNAWIHSTNPGNYTFSIDFTSGMKVSVVYPTGNQAANKVIYFDNATAGWSDLYYRIGHATHTKATAMTLVPGTRNLYKVTTSAYNGMAAWHIGNNCGWTGDNSIYRTNASGYDITMSIKFQHAIVSNDITIIPGSDHSTGGDALNNNCEFYSVTKHPGMLTHNVSITAPTNGTITVAYTDVNGEAQSLTSGNADLAHTCILTISAGASSGYHLATLTVNGADFTSGNKLDLTEDIVIAATFEEDAPATVGDPLDIVDWTATGITINMNGYTSATAGAGWTILAGGNSYSKANRAADRTLVIPVSSLVADDVYRIEAHGTSGAESAHDYLVPHIYESNATLSGTQATSIVVVRQGTLTVDANTTVAAIYVAPGAKLVIANGVTLSITDKLVLRTEPYRAASFLNNGTLSLPADGKKHVMYTRIIKSSKQYYQLALPFACSLSDVYISSHQTMPYGNWLVKRYDAARRADNGPSDGNWVELTSSESLAAHTGYEIYSNSNYYREYYFPVEYTNLSTPQSIDVKVWNSSAAESDKGWNFICSPFTHDYVANSAGALADAVKISVLNAELTYDQDILSSRTLLPTEPFYYQASADGTLDFAASSVSYAASLSPAVARAPMAESVSEQWIRLHLSNSEGLTDVTNIYLHPTMYSADYEVGRDLTKLMGSAARPLIYSQMPCGNLAFNAAPDSVAESGIALGVTAPMHDTYTIRLERSDYIDRLVHLYLVDKELGSWTDLLTDSYTFDAEMGDNTGRLAIQAVFQAPQTATDIDLINGGEYSIMVIGSQLHIEGIAAGTEVRMYDAVGHLLTSAKADGSALSISVSATGVYLLQVGDKVCKVVMDK